MDQMPPPQNVEACVDNGMDLLSVVRTYRYPIGDVAHLWAIMPQYRPHVYRTLDLRPHGIDAQIPEAVIGILHDRRILLKLCYFGKINANLATNHLKVRTEHEVGGSSVTTTELDWKELTSIRNVTDAIINFEVALRLVWPADFTGITMMKLLNDYRYCMFGDEKLSVSVIAQFFERVSNGNRKRAGRHLPPLDFKDQEEALQSTLRDRGLPDTRPSPFSTIPKITADQKALANLQSSLPQGKGQAKNSRQRSQNQAPKPRLPAVQGPSGKYLCWHYNQKTCTRPKHQDGCQDQATSKEYSHHCMYQNPTTMVYCLARHPKQDHK